jgi:hypothetical protein
VKRALKRAARWTPLEPAGPGSDVEDPTVVGVYKNNVYQITMHVIDTALGRVNWLAIVRRDRTAIHDWRDLQRIKNELCGPEREGLELYPAESRLVDTNNQYHLFVLPEGTQIPLGYDERDVCDKPYGVHQQRPFDEPPPGLNAKPPRAGFTKIRVKKS